MTAELLFGFDAEIARWVGERIPHVGPDGFGDCRAIGVANGDKLIAGVVYHQHQPDYQHIQLSMAAVSPMWATREVIAGLLHYPFVQLNVWVLYTLTPEKNTAALKVNEHIGLKHKTIIPHHFGRKRHAVLRQMTKAEYLKAYANGQQKGS